MKRLTKLIAVLATTLTAGGASAKDTFTYSHLIDPVMDAFTYAIREGIVTSDLIEIEFTPLSVPAAIQATATKQFDALMTAAIAIPRAKSKGLDLTILSVGTVYPEGSRGNDVWVLKDSPIKSLEDLKGKSIAVSSYNSTGTTWSRLAIAKASGLDVSYEGGDFNWLEIPAGSQPAALSTGKTDAAILTHSQALNALAGSDYRAVFSAAAANNEFFGVPAVAGVNVGYPEKIAEKPEHYAEFDRMLRESSEYAMSHLDEVSKAVAEGSDMEPDFVRKWVENIGRSPATITAQDLNSLDTIWAGAQELDLLDEYPEAHSVVWDKVLPASE